VLRGQQVLVQLNVHGTQNMPSAFDQSGMGFRTAVTYRWWWSERWASMG
jgi:hypothetical protein